MKNEPISASSGGLSKQQMDAIKLIASGCTARYTALVLKVKYSVIKKWMSKDEQFKGTLAIQLEKLRKNGVQEPGEIKLKRESNQSESIAK